MIVKICLFACLLGCVYSFGTNHIEPHDIFNSILNSRIIKCSQNRSLNLNVSEIKIYFFDFNKNFKTAFSIKDAAKGILSIKKLNKKRKFIMFVGGFTSHINHEIEKQMIEAYKKHPNSYLIIPDHSAYTNNNQGNVRGYERSVAHIHYIGKALGQIWADLKFGGVSSKNIHCVGHSLGGQILGHVGSTFLEITGEKISRVTALDPAGPCFTNSAIEDQVRSGVAAYVEVYHCNSGALGSSSILGDVDFILNENGEMQPNCGTITLPLLYTSSKIASCNHRYCVNLWTASVKYPTMFPAYSCASYEKFKNGECSRNAKTIAGSRNPGKAVGKYYLSTAMYDLKRFM